MDSKSNCLSTVERTVWDGDQVLWEIRADGGDGTTAARMESDSFGPFVNGQLEGQVMYTHGTGIDHPLSILRLGTYGSVFVPVYDWRGSAVSGYCTSAITCGKLVWPEQLQSAWAEDPQPVDGATGQPTYWAGNLIDTKKDGSGYVYMRNRYYDPASERFTQTDPIGLAGGLNAYGFAGGDPVNYSDPFGLCILGKSDETCLKQISQWAAKQASGSKTKLAIKAFKLVEKISTAVSDYTIVKDVKQTRDDNKEADRLMNKAYDLVNDPLGNTDAGSDDLQVSQKYRFKAAQRATDAAKEGMKQEYGYPF